MFLAIAHLPNTGVGKVPVLADPLQTIADLYPNVVGGGADVFVGKIERIHEFAVDVSLELRNSRIADADGSGSAIPFPVLQRLLRKLGVALDREDDRAGSFRIDVFGGVIFDPAHEGSSLLSEADAQKAINCKGGIAHPGVAVIPVARPSDDFRQTRGGRGNDRAGGLKSKKLQRQG